MFGESIAYFSLPLLVLVLYPSLISSTSPIIFPSVRGSSQCDLGIIDEVKDTIRLFLNSTDSSENVYSPIPPVDISNSSRPILATEVYGIQQGSSWDDEIVINMPTIIGIRRLTLSYGRQINSLQINYRLADGTEHCTPTYGNEAGQKTSVVLADDERITKIEGFASSLGITQLTVVTARSSGTESVLGPYGSIGETPFNVSGYILGFRGYELESINALSVYYLPPLFRSPSSYGGTGRRYSHDDNVNVLIPPVVGIHNITVYAGCVIDAIQCTYKLLGRSTYRGNLIGGIGGAPSYIHFGEGDVLYQMRLSTAGEFLDHLDLYVNRSATYSERFGTYGIPANRSFNIVGAILGFYGYASHQQYAPQPWCSSIGVYTL